MVWIDWGETQEEIEADMLQDFKNDVESDPIANRIFGFLKDHAPDIFPLGIFYLWALIAARKVKAGFKGTFGDLMKSSFETMKKAAEASIPKDEDFRL
jgi:hypothetical protein